MLRSESGCCATRRTSTGWTVRVADRPHAFSAQGVPPLTRDGFQFDARPDSPDSDTPIDLPLRDPDSVSGAEPPVSRGDLIFQKPASSSSGRGFSAGMFVIGLVAGFGGGFLVGQRAAPPPLRPSAAQVPRPAPEAGAVPPQNFTEAPVAEPPPPVEVQEPDVRPPISGFRDVPPSPASPEPGTLHVASRPPGAQVYLDEVRVGTTPMTMNNVTPGAHRVRIEMPGHRPWTTSVIVAAGAQARVGASLEQVAAGSS